MGLERLLGTILSRTDMFQFIIKDNKIIINPEYLFYVYSTHGIPPEVTRDILIKQDDEYIMKHCPVSEHDPDKIRISL